MDNVFPADQLKYLTPLTSLQSLSLANNQISEYEHLTPLKSIPNLVQLDLSECAIAEKSDYRKKVFEMLNKLHILDNLDEEGKPFEYSGESDVDEDGQEDEDNQEEFEIDPNQPEVEVEVDLEDEPKTNGQMEPTENTEEPPKLKKTKVD